MRAWAAALAVLLLAPAAASAATHVRSVDASQYPHIRLTVVTGSPQEVPALLEAGKPGASLRVDNLGREKSIALLVDRSRSMRGAAIEDASAAARAFVASKPGADRVAVVAFGSKPVQLTGFSSAPDDAESALATLAIDKRQGTALYDAVAMAAGMLAREPTAGRVILLVTDGADVSSRATLERAVEAAKAARAPVYAVAIQGPQFTPDALRQLADATGGVEREAATSADLRAIYAQIGQELRRTWQLDYLTAGRPGDKLDVSVDGVKVAYTLPGHAEPVRGSWLPQSAYSAGGTAVLGGIVALLVLVAIGVVLVSNRKGRLHGLLAPHVPEEQKTKVRPKTRDRLGFLAAIFRATERAFAHTKQWKKVQGMLDRADLPLRAVELFYLTFAISFGLGLLLAVVGASSILIVLGFAAGVAAPFTFVWFKASRRAAAFEDQLPDLLMSVASTLKAGHSFKQAIQSVVDEGMEPAGKELKRVLAETRLGRPLEEALGQMAERLNSKNWAFIVTAVNVQNQVGGSLAGLFDTVADTVRQRQQFARKIKGLVAMGKMSAYVLLGLPFFVAGALTLLNPEYMDPLYHTSTGRNLVAVALVMMLIGGAFLKKIISFRG